MIDISSMENAKMCDLCNRSVKGIFKNGIWVPLPTSSPYGGYFCGYSCSSKYMKKKLATIAERT